MSAEIVDEFPEEELRRRFELARMAYATELGYSFEAATAKAQMAEDFPEVRRDWTYALAWALFKTEKKGAQ